MSRSLLRHRFAAGSGIVLLTLTALLGGCDHGKGSAGSEQTTAVAGPDHRFPIVVGGQTTHLRLAIHESERQRGLMYVESMPEDEGMLFVWQKPQRMSFYMRNCHFPQDIGFFDAGGVLQEIRPMYPGVEDSVQSTRDNLQLALEMNQGWYHAHGVKSGATIDLAAVRAALHDRGYDPEKYFPTK